MNPFVVLAISFALTFLVETLTEYLFGIPIDKVPKLVPFKWLLMYVSAAFGVGLAFYYQLDLIALIKNLIDNVPLEVSTVGIILTGLAMGRGSNYLHDFVKRFIPIPASAVVKDDYPIG